MTLAGLQERRAALMQEQSDNDQACGTQALAAALADGPARRGLDRLIARGGELAAQIAALDVAIVSAEANEAAAGAAEAVVARRIVLDELRRQLAERLELATTIDTELQGLKMRLSRYLALSAEIVASHSALTGGRLRDDPLLPEAIGGRLAEVMAGLGFDAWLPLARPEIRAAQQSLRAAETVAQRAYQLSNAEVSEVTA